MTNIKAKLLEAARADMIPEASSGLWYVRKYRTSKDLNVPRENPISHRWENYNLPAGAYTQLFRYTDSTIHTIGELVMQDTPDELNTHLDFMLRAHGDVLITGLGLGCVARGTLANPAVKSVTVIERDDDLLKMVLPFMPSGITIIKADSREWVNENSRSFDCAWHDLWTDRRRKESMSLRISIESGHDKRVFSADYAEPIEIIVNNETVFSTTPPDDGKTREEGMNTEPKQPVPCNNYFPTRTAYCAESDHYADDSGVCKNCGLKYEDHNPTRNEVKPCPTNQSSPVSNSPETFKPESGDGFEKWRETIKGMPLFYATPTMVAIEIWNAAIASQTAEINEAYRMRDFYEKLADQLRKQRDDARNCQGQLAAEAVRLEGLVDSAHRSSGEITELVADSLLEWLKPFQAKIDALTLANSELVKDKERLDRLSKGYEWHIDMDYDDGTWGIGTWKGNINDREYKTITDGHETIRSAIDAVPNPSPKD